MDKGSNATWEQVHRTLFPEGTVPAPLIVPKDVQNNGNVRDGYTNQSADNRKMDQYSNFSRPPPPPPHPPPFNQPVLMPSAPNVLPSVAPNRVHFGPPPQMPRDPEVVHNIETVATSVAKYGQKNEEMTRAKQYGNSKFCFLFGSGDSGSEQLIAAEYYRWKKHVLKKIISAREAVTQGRLPPEQLKSMEREIEMYNEQFHQRGSFFPDAESGIPPQSWNRSSKWESDHGQSKDRERRAHIELPMKSSEDVSSFASEGRERERVRNRDPRRNDREAQDTYQYDKRTRRRSLSPTEKGRYPSPKRSRSPRHKQHSRSYSRSPSRQRGRNSSPRRELDKRNGGHHIQICDDRRRQVLLPMDASPSFAGTNQQQQLLISPPSQCDPPGFAALNNNFSAMGQNNCYSLGATEPQHVQNFSAPPPPPPPPNMYDSGFMRIPAAFQPGFSAERFLPPHQQQQQQQQQQQLQQQHFSQQPANDLSSMGILPLPRMAPLPLPPQNLVQNSSDSLTMVPPPPPPPLPLHLPPPSDVATAVYQLQQQNELQQQQPQQQHQQLLMHMIPMGVAQSERYDPIAHAYESASAMKASISNSEVIPSSIVASTNGTDPLVTAIATSSITIAPVMPLVVESQENHVKDDETVTAPDRKESPDTKEEQQQQEKEKEKDGGEESDDTSEKFQKGRNSEKEQRALKILRNAVAEYVKELLNPNFRDGILTKEVFKVIAQKAVNKVIGNLQGSQIPRGQEKIDRFITSSKEKITKLVQGYIEKHTKSSSSSAAAAAAADAAD